MANMAYCRFENAVGDLIDCMEHLHEDLSSDEARCREKLIELCKDIADEFSDDDSEG